MRITSVITVVALIASALSGAALAGDGTDNAGAGPFIFGLLGAVPVLVPTLLLFTRLGHDKGKSEERFSNLVRRVDDLERSLDVRTRELRSELQFYETKENLILRLNALEEKIKADVARSLTPSGANPKGAQHV